MELAAADLDKVFFAQTLNVGFPPKQTLAPGGPPLSWSARRGLHPHGSDYRSDLVRDGRIFRCQLVDVADLYVFRRHYGWPFSACAEEPFALSEQTRGVEGTSRNKQLNPLAASNVRPDDYPLSISA